MPFNYLSPYFLSELVQTLWQRPSQTKVTNFDLTLIVDQNIIWFNIPMHNVGRSYELDSTHQVVNDKFEVVLVKTNLFAALEQLLKVGHLELHHHKYIFYEFDV
jgi:hypothetical protein